MVPALEAYEALLAIANDSVRTYRIRDVYPALAWTTTDNAIIGTGYDYAAGVPLLPNIKGLPPVVGLAQLRLVRLAPPRPLQLYIHIRFSWTISVGGSHGSFAAYEITPAVAAELAKAETIQRRRHNIGKWLRRHNIGEWLQTYPGRPGVEPDADTLAHHAEIIRAAKADQPDLLGMLSDTDNGCAEPEHLVGVHRWIQGRNPSSALDGV
jgi:hypothetical protein